MTELENLAKPVDLGPVLALFDGAAERGQTARLDLSALDRDGSESRRVDLLSVALLSNLLLGAHSDVSVEVTLPSAPGILGQLRRGGLLFALAQRSGPVSFAGDLTNEILAGWRGAWRPGLGEQLFADASADEVDERLYLYANTHRLGEGHFRQYQPGAAMPWVANLVPVPKNALLKHTRQNFVASSVEAIVEVLENLAAHAFKRRQRIDDDWLHPAGRRGKAMLLCSLTRGGGKASWDRLHVLAMDNGYGIGRTLRWQHPETTASTADLLQAVLQRKFMERGIPGHAGRGLWYLHGLARVAGGAVRVVTEDDLSLTRDGVVYGFSTVPAEDGATTWEEPQRVQLPVRGTLLLLDLDVPSAAHGDTSGMGDEYRALRGGQSATR